MNPDVKAQWTSALRSGEYRRTTGYLHTDAGFCCLGVLCDVAVKNGVIPEPTNDDYYRIYEGNNSALLPAVVAEWAGLDDNEDPSLVHVTIAGTETESLAGLNDSGEYNFNQIADVIEEQL